MPPPHNSIILTGIKGIPYFQYRKDGIPIMLFDDQTNHNFDLVELHFTSSLFDLNTTKNLTRIDTTGNVGGSIIFRLDSNDYPVGLYQDESNNALKYYRYMPHSTATSPTFNPSNTTILIPSLTPVIVTKDKQPWWTPKRHLVIWLTTGVLVSLGLITLLYLHSKRNAQMQSIKHSPLEVELN